MLPIDGYFDGGHYKVALHYKLFIQQICNGNCVKLFFHNSIVLHVDVVCLKHI